MRVAVVAVGDKLLLGEVVNSNLAWLGRALADAGLQLVRAYEVGDDVDAVVSVLREALGVAEAVVVRGGLGPTSDDRTREALARLAGVAPAGPELLERLTSWYAARRPSDAAGHRGPGRAPGRVARPAQPGRLRARRPGRARRAPWWSRYPRVPRELEAMLGRHVVPELRGRAGLPAAVATPAVHVAALGESLVAERLAPLEAALPAGVRMSYLAAPGDVRVRFTGTDVPLLEALRVRAAGLLGDVVSGRGDETLPYTVLRLLGEQGATVATAESLTGGALASALVDVPGASASFRGGVVAYATELKALLLDVPADGLARPAPSTRTWPARWRPACAGGWAPPGGWPRRAWRAPTPRTVSRRGPSWSPWPGRARSWPGGWTCGATGRPYGRSPWCTRWTCCGDSSSGRTQGRTRGWNHPDDYPVTGPAGHRGDVGPGSPSNGMPGTARRVVRRGPRHRWR